MTKRECLYRGHTNGRDITYKNVWEARDDVARCDSPYTAHAEDEMDDKREDEFPDWEIIRPNVPRKQG